VRIIFIRHGRTRSNTDHCLDTAFPGRELDEVGLAQAAALPARLSNEPIEVVMTSDLTRARQTGEPLAQALGVPLITHPGVREIYAGDWEMSTDWSGYIRTAASWPTDPAAAMPNGDDGVSFFARFDAALLDLQDYGCAAVVSHGGALLAWLTGRGGRRIGADAKWELHNTDVVVVEGVPGSWQIQTWAGQGFDQ